MSKRYINYLSRIGFSSLDVKAWYEGESSELMKVLGCGFFNTIFLVEKDNVCAYYEAEEVKNFDKALDELLTEDFFNNICDDFFELIRLSKETFSHEGIFEIIVKCWPALTIFHEISNYPEYANKSMLRRLFKIRKSTESFIYELSHKLSSSEEPNQNYILFKGKILNCPFDDFCRENNFIVENE